MTVLPLAVVAAFGSEFWVIAMRGAVGAVDRTGRPFVAWLQESTALLPMYLLAVLVSLSLASRWFGPGPLRARTVMLSLLLVAVASTLVAVAVQGANALHDYHRQAVDLATTASHANCVAECLTARQNSALLLQIRALGLGGLLTLVSNLFLLGLLVAFRGGRLDVTSTRRTEPTYSQRKSSAEPLQPDH